MRVRGSGLASRNLPNPTGSSTRRTHFPHPPDPGTAAPASAAPTPARSPAPRIPSAASLQQNLRERQLQVLLLQRLARPRRRVRQTTPQHHHPPAPRPARQLQRGHSRLPALPGLCPTSEARGSTTCRKSAWTDALRVIRDTLLEAEAGWGFRTLTPVAGTGLGRETLGQFRLRGECPPLIGSATAPLPPSSISRREPTWSEVHPFSLQSLHVHPTRASCRRGERLPAHDVSVAIDRSRCPLAESKESRIVFVSCHVSRADGLCRFLDLKNATSDSRYSGRKRGMKDRWKSIC